MYYLECFINENSTLRRGLLYCLTWKHTRHQASQVCVCLLCWTCCGSDILVNKFDTLVKEVDRAQHSFLRLPEQHRPQFSLDQTAKQF